ncbi:MAG: NAD-dependent epimerase/dehydratase family protein [Alphaproteobacteria bacterium]|nr:NAD-dependent epimerase/dehydratase family protein [Alphaproteobacteria bacterium]
MTFASLSGRRVIVTGVSGFVGGSIANAWAHAGATVLGLCRSAARPPDIAAGVDVRVCTYASADLVDTIARFEPDVILHAAGSASVAASLADPAADFASTVALFQTLLEATRRTRVRPLVIYPSSAAVYGNPDRLPVAETAALHPVSPYGHHKMMAEALGREYAVCFGVPVLAVRFFSIFGPRQKRLLLWELFRRFVDEPSVTVRGSGNEVRDFLHIEDVAASLASMLGRLAGPYATVNLASGRGTSVADMARLVGRHLGSTKDIVFGNRAQPSDPDRWIADIAVAAGLGAGIPPNGSYDLEARVAATLRAWTS